jgi:predicted ester cyclase
MAEVHMTYGDIQQRLAAHQAGFDGRNPDALAMSHAPDGSFHSPAHGLVRGRDAIRDVYRYWYRAFPDFLLKWDSAIVEAPRAAVFWSFEGTAAGPFFGDVKAGARVSMLGAAEYIFGEAGITSARHIYDFSGLLVTTGVLKVKPAG